MKPEIILVGPLMDSVMQRLDKAYKVHRLFEADRDALLRDVGPRIQAVATDGALGAGRDLLSQLQSVRMVGIFGVGLDAVDLDYTRAHGIKVSNTPDVLTDDVADLALMLMLCVARQQIVADRFVRAGEWGKASLPLANRFSGKRVGILGLGRVGQAVVGRCRAFDCEISYVDPYATEQDGITRFDSLADMAAAVDYLVVTAAGGTDTRKLVDAEILNALGPQGALVNVSRGSIVDEDALVAALKSGRLGAAGLDVFANEPQVPQQLLRMDNVVLTPHRASATIETREAMGNLLIDNLAAHFAGEELLTPVA